MKLKKAAELSVQSTYGDCIQWVVNNQEMLFDYENIITEINELMNDFRKTGKKLTDKVDKKEL